MWATGVISFVLGPKDWTQTVEETEGFVPLFIEAYLSVTSKQETKATFTLQGLMLNSDFSPDLIFLFRLFTFMFEETHIWHQFEQISTLRGEGPQSTLETQKEGWGRWDSMPKTECPLSVVLQCPHTPGWGTYNMSVAPLWLPLCSNTHYKLLKLSIHNLTSKINRWNVKYLQNEANDEQTDQK